MYNKTLPKKFYLEDLIYSTQRRTIKTNFKNLLGHFNCWKRPKTVEFTNGLILTFEEIKVIYPEIKIQKNLFANE